MRHLTIELLRAIPALALVQANSQTCSAGLIHTRNLHSNRSLECSLKTCYEKLPTASPLAQFMTVVRPTQRLCYRKQVGAIVATDTPPPAQFNQHGHQGVAQRK